MKDYYYTDKEELDALRAENQELKQEIAELKDKLAKKTKKGGTTNGNQEN